MIDAGVVCEPLVNAPAPTPRPRGNVREAEPGYVLHTYPFKETSLVAELFTRNGGRIGLVAKGATLDGFDIAGDDLVLHSAQARIEGGSRVRRNLDFQVNPLLRIPALFQGDIETGVVGVRNPVQREDSVLQRRLRRRRSDASTQSGDQRRQDGCGATEGAQFVRHVHNPSWPDASISSQRSWRAAV